jgi:hypothetical protein
LNTSRLSDAGAGKGQGEEYSGRGGRGVFHVFLSQSAGLKLGGLSSLFSVIGGRNPSTSLAEISLHSHSKHGSRVPPVSYDVDNEP